MYKAAIFLSLIALWGGIGLADQIDETRQRAYYCEMVESGAWPDYKGTSDDC